MTVRELSDAELLAEFEATTLPVELFHHRQHVRTAWLYGAHGSCFPKTMARLVRERGEVSVVTDQVGQPTWTRDVAGLIIRLVEARAAAGTRENVREHVAEILEERAAAAARARTAPL